MLTLINSNTNAPTVIGEKSRIAFWVRRCRRGNYGEGASMIKRNSKLVYSTEHGRIKLKNRLLRPSSAADGVVRIQQGRVEVARRFV